MKIVSLTDSLSAVKQIYDLKHKFLPHSLEKVRFPALTAAVLLKSTQSYTCPGFCILESLVLILKKSKQNNSETNKKKNQTKKSTKFIVK